MAQDSMTRDELVEYLRVVADAENAIAFCEKAEEELYLQIGEHREKTLPAIKAFTAPKKKPSEFSTFSTSLEAYIFLCSFFLILILIIMLLTGNTLGIILSVILFLFAIFILPPGLILVIYNLYQASKREQRFSQDKAAAQSTYAAYKRRTEAEIRTITAENATRAQMRALLTQEVQALSARIADLHEKRDRLYACGIIYPKFRNMMAVNQLLEYIEMGMCTELGGPHGAYAKYMDDLHTEQICGSIGQLEQAVRRGFSAVLTLQARTVECLQATQRQIAGLGEGIQRDLRQMQQQIRISDEHTQASLADINAQAARIAQNTGSLALTAKTAAWNEYITQLESGVDSYYLHHPV